jgi:chromosome segregation ATPase
VDAINNVEREQGRRINEAAERSAAIRRQRSELEAAQREQYEKLRALSQEEKKLRDARDDIERRLAEKRKLEPNLERRTPELDRELREVRGLLAELLRVDEQNARQRQEVVRLRERTVAIPNEKNDLRTHHFRLVNEIRALEEALGHNEGARVALETEKEKLETEWQTKERQFTEAIKDEEREKAALEKGIAELERAKANPYQKIGQVLALAHVAPMNQPQALDAVKTLEFAIGGIQQDLLESEQASAGENRAMLRISYGLLAGILAAIAIVAWAAM